MENPARRARRLVSAGVGPFSRRGSERCIVGLALQGGTAAGGRIRPGA